MSLEFAPECVTGKFPVATDVNLSLKLERSSESGDDEVTCKQNTHTHAHT